MSMLRRSGFHFLAVIPLALFTLTASGCFLATVDTIEQKPRPSSANIIFIGTVNTAKPEWQRTVRLFRSELADQLMATHTFRFASARIPVKMPHNALVLTGRFVEIDQGSEVARWLIGNGMGSPTIEARFEVSDASGNVLFSFEQSGLSFEGSGSAAHWNPVDMDVEIADYAEETALAVADWGQTTTQQ